MPARPFVGTNGSRLGETCPGAPWIGAVCGLLSKTRDAFVRSLPATLAALSLVVSVVVATSTPATSIRPLTVVGSLIQAGEHWDIEGRVLQDGDGADQAFVWAIVEYTDGEHASPPLTETHENGEFLIGQLPRKLGTSNSEIAQATIYAKKKIPGGWFRSPTTLRGEDKVQAPNVQKATASAQTTAGAPACEAAEVLGLPPLILAPLIMIFLISAMLPFFGEPTRKKYLAAIVLAFCVTGTMIAYFSVGLRFVTTEGKQKEVLQLGFASIYRSSYVEHVQPEWVFSFTAPPPRPTESAPSEKTQPGFELSTNSDMPQATANPSSHTKASNSDAGSSPSQPAGAPTRKGQTDSVVIDRGFGAPLWVLLLSVVGASLVTIGLIVSEIAQMPPANQPDEIRKHIQTIVQHQFFILFAPVTAIFVYQIMLAGSAATSAFTVGLTALGAGPSLSALLTKAGAAATKLFA